MGPVETWMSVVGWSVVLGLVWALTWSVPAILLRRNDLADVLWGPTFVWLALLGGGTLFALDWDNTPRATIVVVLLVAWALRLAWHIGRRWLSHDEEDKRYAAMRERWGSGWMLRSILQVFVLQALIALVVVQPVLVAVPSQEGDVTLGILDALATFLVLAGLALESTADRQLRRFLAARAAGTEERRYLTTGVWSWSRHPNYAGDAITWWGFGAFGIAAALDMDAPWLILPAVVGPLVMTWFLRYGSGVALSERGRAGHPEWDAYVERTSAFLPRPPRRAVDPG
jgi:steroid 5-alpha reductase family enzyme